MGQAAFSGSSPLGKGREIASSSFLQEFSFSSSIILDTSSSSIDPMSIEWDDVKSWVKKIKKEAKAYNHNLVSFEYELSLSIAPLEIKTLINAKNLAQFENYLRDNIAKDEVPFRNDYGKKDIKQLISGIDFSRYEGDNIKTYRRFVSNAFYDCIMYLKKHYQWSFQFVMNQIESISFNENHFFGVNKRAKLYFGVKDIGDSIWKKEILSGALMEESLHALFSRYYYWAGGAIGEAVATKYRVLMTQNTAPELSEEYEQIYFDERNARDHWGRRQDNIVFIAGLIHKNFQKELNSGKAEELKDKLSKNLQDGMLKIAVDLSGCNYMDSSFLGVLVQSLKNYSQKGGEFVLVNPHGEVEILLDITGMRRIFKIFDTVEEAVKSFS